MKVGFTGTQDGMTEIQKKMIFDLIDGISVTGNYEAHHGCCIGADTDFHKMHAKMERKGRIVLHPPSNISKLDKDCYDIHDGWEQQVRDALPYLERNRQIVNQSQMLIGAPKGHEVIRSGTWSTIRYAKKLGRIVIIIYPDGHIEEFNRQD